MFESAQECRDRAAALRAAHETSSLMNKRARYEAVALRSGAMVDTADRIGRALRQVTIDLVQRSTAGAEAIQRSRNSLDNPLLSKAPR